MAEASYLRNQLLIAMPSMVGDAFDRSVTYLCAHSADGAMGLVVNRPTELSLASMLEHMELDITVPQDGSARAIEKAPVFWGGPVQSERGFVLHREAGGWDATLSVNDEFFITTSRDILEAIAQGDGPESFIVTLGYAGWGEGQLESEIRANAWLNCAADDGVVFDTPAAERWTAAIGLLGLDPKLLSASAGHA